MSQVFAARGVTRRTGVLVAIAMTVLFALSLQHTGIARADGPGVGTPWVTSVGDSYISGEAGRWAGNTNGSSSNIDALGSTAYYDNATNTAEPIPGCHRSQVGRGLHRRRRQRHELRVLGRQDVDGRRLGNFKPGLDFYSSGANQGQALMLQKFATTHNVKMVVALDRRQQLQLRRRSSRPASTDFLTSPSWWTDYCNDDSSVTANFTAANITRADHGHQERRSSTSVRR